jgi:hypothetical protein
MIRARPESLWVVEHNTEEPMTATAASIESHHPDRTRPATDRARAAIPSRRAAWAGRILSGLALLFLAFDAAIKLLQLGPAVEGTLRLGYPVEVIPVLGILQLACLALYIVPRTAIVGAILWTGYLGGAVATHVRVGDPLASHVLFPIYVAAFLWLGLWLRDGALRALLPTRAPR